MTAMRVFYFPYVAFDQTACIMSYNTDLSGLYLSFTCVWAQCQQKLKSTDVCMLNRNLTRLQNLCQFSKF